MRRLRIAGWPAWLPVCAVALCCSRWGVSDVAQMYGYDQPARRAEPLVMVAGFLGSILVDQESGRTVWGEFLTGEQWMRSAATQRRVALPMVGGDTLTELRDGVTPTEVMVNVRVRGRVVNAYPGVVVGMLGAAATAADERGRPSRSRLRKHARDSDLTRAGGFYGVPYDWRRDISEATSQLDEQIRRAHEHKRALGLSGAEARVDVIAHSMGALLVRYYLRYGTQPLPGDGSLPELDWRGAERVRRVILAGAPNGGSLDAFRSVALGYKVIPILPRYPAALIGTFPSIYQLMPRTGDGSIVHADGSAVDLYDAATWERHGWGLFAEDQDEVLANLMPSLPTREERRSAARRYLELVLARAEQFHRALDMPARPPPGTTLHLFAGDTLATPQSAVLDLKGRKATEVIEAPGDGTVTRRSALHDTRRDPHTRSRVASPISWTSVHFVEGNHLDMVGRPGLVDDLLYLIFQAPPDERSGIDLQ